MQLCAGMVDGITHCLGSQPPFPQGDGKSFFWDSRECPGPSTEAELSRPSTRRALTAGALVLAVIAPAIVESFDRPADAGAVPPSVSPVVEAPGFDPAVTFGKRPARVSRAQIRRAKPARPAYRRGGARPAAVQVKRAVRQVKEQQVRRIVSDSGALPARRNVAHRERARRFKNAKMGRVMGASPGMGAVIAYARAQIGKSYVSGGSGPSVFDCSGFTKRAYAQAGIPLPHSSGAQAARARSIPRSRARPGDLVVGPGHVGIYMGGGMMIDAGNHRTGVVYRRMYAGLHVERL